MALSPDLVNYLRSRRWKKLAREVKKRDRWRCQACGIRPQRRPWWKVWERRNWLTAHHQDYRAWRRSPGNEPLTDLITLCRFCHDEFTTRYRTGKWGHYDGSLRHATQQFMEGKRRNAGLPLHSPLR